MRTTLMNLKVLLPTGIFVDESNVSGVVLETNSGSFGLLPNRLDCVASLVPGILTYQNKSEGEKFVAIDEGVLIKTGLNVLVSVRKAIADRPLGELREALEEQFMSFTEDERKIRETMSKMESSFIKRIARIHNE